MGDNKELVKGCEHDGSYVPISEVYRLMNEARKAERQRIVAIVKNAFKIMKEARPNAWGLVCIEEELLSQIEKGE